MTVLYWIAGSHLEALPYLDKIHEMNLLLPEMKKHGSTTLADVSGIGWNRRSDSYEFQPDTVLFMAGNAKELVADLETFRKNQAGRVGFKSVPDGDSLYAIARGDGYWLDTQEYVMMLALGSDRDLRIPHTHSVPHKFFTAVKRTVDTPKNLIDVKDLINLCKQFVK